MFKINGTFLFLTVSGTVFSAEQSIIPNAAYFAHINNSKKFSMPYQVRFYNPQNKQLAVKVVESDTEASKFLDVNCKQKIKVSYCKVFFGHNKQTYLGFFDKHSNLLISYSCNKATQDITDELGNTLRPGDISQLEKYEVDQEQVDLGFSAPIEIEESQKKSCLIQ